MQEVRNDVDAGVMHAAIWLCLPGIASGPRPRSRPIGGCFVCLQNTRRISGQCVHVSNSVNHRQGRCERPGARCRDTRLSDVKVVVCAISLRVSSPFLTVMASSEHSSNKLFQAALLDLSHTGDWQLFVELDGRTQFEVRVEVEAAPPTWLPLIPWVGWPFVAVLLVFLPRWLLATREATSARSRVGDAVEWASASEPARRVRARDRRSAGIRRSHRRRSERRGARRARSGAVSPRCGRRSGARAGRAEATGVCDGGRCSALTSSSTCSTASLTAIVDGGWGIDALIETHRSEHDDLDLVVPKARADAVADTLRPLGFDKRLDELPTAHRAVNAVRPARRPPRRDPH